MEYRTIKKELYNVDIENLKKLANLFPNVVKDGQLDINALKEELGLFEEVGQEKYEFNWAGKRNAKKEARKNIFGKTLRYKEGDGVDENTTHNLFIEGDNLEVMKLLRKNYYGKIKMIYIDPPYNTGNDFIYNDDFSIKQGKLEWLQGECNEYTEHLRINTEESARYHTNWLNMMYPRLLLAKDLLTNDGVIFISIDDNEQANLKIICDEIFGASNFVNCIAVKMSEATGVKMSHQHKRYPKIKEYILFYKKNSFSSFECIDKYKQENWDKENNIFLENITETTRKRLIELTEKDVIDENDIKTANLLLREVKKIPLSEKIKELSLKGEELRCWLFNNAYRIIKTAGSLSLTKVVRGYDIPNQDIASGISNEGILFFYITDFNKQASQPRLRVIFADENIYKNPCDFWQDIKTSGAISDEGGVKYKNGKKPLRLLKRMIKMTTKNNDIILDFFGGSASTAHACLEVNQEDGGNRQFIVVQIPENIDNTLMQANGESKNDIKDVIKFLDSIGKPHELTELGKERIRRAGQKIKENLEKVSSNVHNKLTDIGFKVFRVGETTLKWEELHMPGKDKNYNNLIDVSEKDMFDFSPDFHSDLNIVYEIMLRQEGLSLTSKIEKLTDIGLRTYLVASTYLICLEEKITQETVEKMSALNPLPFKFIFRNSAFDDIACKDEIFRTLNSLINKKMNGTSHTLEFI